MSVLGDAIRFYREQQGWSQAELGRRAGVEYSTINAVEAGTQQSIRSDRLKALAEALGVAVDILLNGDTSATSQAPTSAPINGELALLWPVLNRDDQETVLRVVRGLARTVQAQG